MTTPFLVILWQLALPSLYSCHLFRPRTGLIQVRAGTNYGVGKVLAEGTEDPDFPGSTIPELLEVHWVRLKGRTLCPTVHGHSVVGQSLPHLSELFGRSDPQIGEVWSHAGRRFRDRSTEVPASTVMILEHLRDSRGPLVRVRDLQTGRIDEHPLVPFRSQYRLVPEPPALDPARSNA